MEPTLSGQDVRCENLIATIVHHQWWSTTAGCISPSAGSSVGPATCYELIRLGVVAVQFQPRAHRLEPRCMRGRHTCVTITILYSPF